MIDALPACSAIGLRVLQRLSQPLNFHLEIVYYPRRFSIFAPP
jgi:hypothetical protein